MTYEYKKAAIHAAMILIEELNTDPANEEQHEEFKPIINSLLNKTGYTLKFCYDKFYIEPESDLSYNCEGYYETKTGFIIEHVKNNWIVRREDWKLYDFYFNDFLDALRFCREQELQIMSE